MKYDVYISYVDQDIVIVNSIVEYLNQFNIRSFLRNTTKINAAILVQALEHSTIMLFVYSDNSKNSDLVDKELDLASEYKKAILTIRITDEDFKGAKKYYLKNLNWIDAFPNPENEFNNLVYNVAHLIGVNLPEPKGQISIKCDTNAILSIDGNEITELKQDESYIYITPIGEYIISLQSKRFEDVRVTLIQSILNKKFDLHIQLLYEEKEYIKELSRNLEIEESPSKNKYGFVDSYKKGLVIQYSYDHVSSFSCGLALVRIGEKKGFINKLGKVIVPIIYDDAVNFTEGIAVVYKEKAGALINTSGEFLTPFEFGYIYPFKEGRAKARDLEYNGFIIDKQGKKIFECRYYETEAFYKNGKIKTEKGYRGLNGEFIEMLPKGREAKKNFKKKMESDPNMK